MGEFVKCKRNEELGRDCFSFRFQLLLCEQCLPVQTLAYLVVQQILVGYTQFASQVSNGKLVCENDILLPLCSKGGA